MKRASCTWAGCTFHSGLQTACNGMKCTYVCGLLLMGVNHVLERRTCACMYMQVHASACDYSLDAISPKACIAASVYICRGGEFQVPSPP